MKNETEYGDRDIVIRDASNPSELLHVKLKAEIDRRKSAEAETTSLKARLDDSLKREEELRQTVQLLMNSSSWKMTGPYRIIGRQIKRIAHFMRATPTLANRHGGYLALLSKAFVILRHRGLRGAISAWRVANAVNGETVQAGYSDARNDYSVWLKRYSNIDDTVRGKMIQEIDGWSKMPVISIVMPVYNPPLNFLKAALDSVLKQVYPNWELCIADDCSTDPNVKEILEQYSRTEPRIKVIYREKNGHISEASNSAIAIADGEWVALFDQDDLISEDALFYVAREINRNNDVQLIYSDEDKVDGQRRFDPYFKPDWNPDLLRSQNFVSHLGVYKTDRVREIGGFRKGFEGSQDHDLVLRFSENLKINQIAHIPRVLYHWRSHSESTAQSTGNKSYAVLAGQKALQEHLDRLNIGATVHILPTNMYKIKYFIPDNPPLVSIIIPTRNNYKLLKQCIDSVILKTDYDNFEIIVIDNNSNDMDTLNYLDKISRNNHVTVTRDEGPFNYSALNNRAVEKAKGEFVVLMNNDIEVISPDWLSEMMGYAIQQDVGAVGARLWYPNDTLQHGGVILGVLGVAGHSHKCLPKGAHGYFARAELAQTLSAVTAACLLVRKKIYEEVKGLDEKNLKVAFNDVDFCVRVREAGYRNVWTPYAELYHHESATRGHEDTPEKMERFRAEVNYMLERWGNLLTRDPAYNPNLTLTHDDFSLAWPPRNDSDPTLAS